MGMAPRLALGIPTGYVPRRRRTPSGHLTEVRTMTARFIIACSFGVLLLAAAASAQNATVDIPELVLNRLVAGMGARSASGVYQPTGTVPASSIVPWQWWVM